jgi:ADP-ribose pyrophosphatase
MNGSDEFADRPAGVILSVPESLANGFFEYHRFRFTDGHGTPRRHDVLRGPKAAAVLAIDLALDEAVFIRQFRPAAQLANGNGELIEIVAGRIEPGERLAETARRECVEEIGVAPTALVEVMTFLTSPGLTDEEITLFAGAIDASKISDRAGAPDEGEDIRPFRMPIDDVIAALPRIKVRNAPLIIALQWLALNRHRLREILTAGGSS